MAQEQSEEEALNGGLRGVFAQKIIEGYLSLDKQFSGRTIWLTLNWNKLELERCVFLATSDRQEKKEQVLGFLRPERASD
ncbi:predicted protein [Sclerotinia sclerotiorum 1980 UF-70]|uniref:Uncharacterized protein n=1 Tax=Sclerotinia sclerotiorum (strain ATCC 18683 / 1980 / Ss-1) TaxID=665079 RepID=A7EJH8_SCLS1|nr:predicted protein [Sclerotinia sclerotiorum 1980 UF-70]EDO02994.1 predicted protein [Sclerotinia sclerotiorum 1980 UF-70]